MHLLQAHGTLQTSSPESMGQERRVLTETSTHAGFFSWSREAQIALQPDGTISAWNPAAARFLQIPADDAIGRPLAELLPDIADLVTAAPAISPSVAPEWRRRTLTLGDGAELTVEVAVAWQDGHVLLILADCRALVAAERAALDADRWYRSMLNALPIGVTVVSLRDERYPTLYQNDWGIEVSGWANEERDPDFTLQILHPDDREQMLAFRDEFRDGFKSFDVEYRVVRPDGGGVVWLRDWGTIVYDETGLPDRNVVCLMDITRQKSAELALRDALQDLSEAHTTVQAISQAKSEYFSFLSHEFRTPLTSLQGFSELITGGGLPGEEVREFAEIIGLNAQRLARMITDLLDMDRLESGQRPMRLGDVRLDTLIADVLDTLSGLGHDHHVTLTVADDLPAIWADSDQLTQVITNVLGNAIKYTPPGGRIAITLTRADQEAVEVAITDHGPGIPPDKLKAIFDRFTRLARDDRQQTVGSGLGLPIARQIVELHDGCLWAENVESGARFMIRLPVAGPEPASN
jgi:signal transduction histidine kinase